MNKRFNSLLNNSFFELFTDFPVETIDNAIFFKYYISDVPIKEKEEQNLMRIWEGLNLNNRFDRVKVLNAQMYLLLDRFDRLLILKAQYDLADDKLSFCHFMKGLILKFYDNQSKNKNDNLKIRKALDPCIFLLDECIKKVEQDVLSPTVDSLEEDDSKTNILANHAPDLNKAIPPITYIKSYSKEKELIQFQTKFIRLLDFFGKGTPAERKNKRNKLEYFEYTDEQFKKWLCTIDVFNSLEALNIKDKISKSRSVESEKGDIIKDPFPTYLQDALVQYFNEK